MLSSGVAADGAATGNGPDQAASGATSTATDVGAITPTGTQVEPVAVAGVTAAPTATYPAGTTTETAMGQQVDSRTLAHKVGDALGKAGLDPMTVARLMDAAERANRPDDDANAPKSSSKGERSDQKKRDDAPDEIARRLEALEGMIGSIQATGLEERIGRLVPPSGIAGEGPSRDAQRRHVIGLLQSQLPPSATDAEITTAREELRRNLPALFAAPADPYSGAWSDKGTVGAPSAEESEALKARLKAMMAGR